MDFLTKLFKRNPRKEDIGENSSSQNSRLLFSDVESSIYPYFKQVISFNNEAYPLPENLADLDKTKVYRLPGTELIIKNICGDLNCFYAVDKEYGYQLITKTHLVEWGVDELKLHEIAIDNFRDLVSKKLKIHGDTNALMFTLNGNLEAGLILIDEIWKQLEDQIGEPVVTAIPARDVVVVTGKSNRKMIDSFNERAIEILTNGDHPLSKHWFIRSGGGWKVFEKIID